jgi:16S rRNA (uracil1498-N3)-methyltransferase
VNPALRGSAAHVFVDSLEHPVLAADDDHHLRRVLRLRAGERISLADGGGRWMEAVLTDAGVQATGEVHVEAAHPRRTVAAAVPKGDRLEWMVQKLTELGVDRIVLLECERSVVRWDAARAAKQLERLRRIAREASSQSRRVWLPEIVAGDLDGLAAEASGGSLALAEPGGASLPDGVTTIAVGPEGGFSPSELAHDLPRVGLAETVLRVETAAVVAAVCLARR